MNDLQLKQLISHRTGVELINKIAMPVFKGQSHLQKRGLIWHNFSIQNGLPEHFPDMMKRELTSFIGRFRNAYMEYVPEANAGNFDSMMFIWYAEDASVTDEDFQKLSDSNINEESKKKMLEVAQEIQHKGVPLAMSKNEFEANKSPYDKEGGFNGGSVHLQHYGWAWGAKEGEPQDDGSRRSDHIPDKVLSNPMEYAKLQKSGKTLVTIETREVEGGWGIFFWDGTEAIPVMPQKTLEQMKSHKAKTDSPLNPDDPAVKGILAGAGGIEKFFWYSSDKVQNSEAHKTKFMPCQRRFVLDSPDDPKPKGILWKTPGKEGGVENHPANDGRHRGQYVGGTRRKPWVDPKVHIAMLRVNGTMFWQNQANPSVQFPMTKEQVDSFNRYKGETFALQNPGYKQYAFDNDADKKKYENDCYWLNQLRDFLVSIGKTHVASQMYQTILVGPRFTAAKQIGEKTAPGFMSSPETQAPTPAPATVTAQVATPGKFTGRRDDWVVQKHEYTLSDYRADMEKGSFNAPQSVSGMAGRGEEYGATCEAAVAKAIRAYNLPERVMPGADQIKAAQDAFDAAQQKYSQKDQPLQNTPQQPIAPANVAPAELQPAAPTPQVETPALQVNNNIPLQQEQNMNPIQPKDDVFAKSSKDIMNKLKKLG